MDRRNPAPGDASPADPPAKTTDEDREPADPRLDPMDLLLALVCDDARPDDQGKLDIHGVFNDLYAPGFPAKQDQMVLVMVVEWDRSDAGRYRFKVDLVGPGGRPTLTVDGHTDVDERADDRPPARTRLVMPLEDVIFPEPGAYRFVIKVKGREMEGPALYLVRSEAGGEPMGIEPSS